MIVHINSADCVKLQRLTDNYNHALAAIGTSLRWSPSDLALRILREGVNGRIDFLPENNVHSRYQK